MVNARQQKDVATRLDELKHLIEQLQQDIEDIRDEGGIAPSGCWIVRYGVVQNRVTLWGKINQFSRTNVLNYCLIIRK